MTTLEAPSIDTECTLGGYWRATFSGWEPGDLVGTGTTEGEAIADLIMQQEDRAS